MRYYIAVDFDGTLCDNAFPEIGAARLDVIQSLCVRCEQLKQEGHEPVIILWTCREDMPERAYLTEAVEWCKTAHIEIDYINENPEYNMGYPEKVRKIYADEYWDDKAICMTST